LKPTAWISSLDANADIIAQPDIARRIQASVPLQKLLKRNARSGVERPTAVAAHSLVESLAVAHNTRHLLAGRWSRGRRGGSGWAGCVLRARHVDADIVVEPEVGAV
jgi:hypothetical protein